MNLLNRTELTELTVGPPGRPRPGPGPPPRTLEPPRQARARRQAAPRMRRTRPRTWFPPVSERSPGAAPNRPGFVCFFSETFEDAPDARRGQCVNSVPRRLSGAHAHHRAVPHMSRPGGEPARCVHRAVFGSRGAGVVTCVPAGVGLCFIGSLRSLRQQVVRASQYRCTQPVQNRWPSSLGRAVS